VLVLGAVANRVSGMLAERDEQLAIRIGNAVSKAFG